MKSRLFLAVVVFLAISSCNRPVQQIEGLVEINGTELYIKTIGTGEPIVFIHGGPGLGFDYFLPQMEELSEDYRLIFFDQRISGRSSANVSQDSISLDYFVSDIEALRRYLKLEEINVLAHSWGNFLALEYALKYPTNLGKIILSNPVPFSKEFDEEVRLLQQTAMDSSFMANRAEIMNSEAFTKREISAFEELFLLSFSLSYYDEANMNEMNFKLFEGFFERNSKMQYFTGLEEFDFYPRLSQIENPVLLIRGEYDLSARNADVKTVDSLRNARLVEMKFSGHFPFIEQQVEYIWEVKNFLEN